MFCKFLKDEDGAQVIEYALVISVLSIVLVLAVDALTIGGSFASIVGRMASCLATTVCI